MCLLLNRRPLLHLGGAVAHRRRGLTLAELLMSITVMGMVALAMAALATAVRGAKDHAEGLGIATQHARVALDRIQNMVSQATATPDFPGIAVFSEQAGGYSFPDTLVVWHPTGAPASPAGPPLYKELFIYCPDPAAPNRLLEITVPNDTRPVPALTETATWQSNLATIKTSSTSTKVLLTDLLRVANSNSGTGTSLPRGAVRFQAVIRPTMTDWTNYKSGSLTWSSLPWVQDIHGSQTGLRQSWCSTELQLMPGSDAAALDPNGTRAMAFFGSAALFYEMHK